MKTAAAQAREKAGLARSEAARQAGCCEAYLRRIERSGGCSYPLAQRLSKLYRCSINVFITNEGRQTPTGSTSTKRRAKRTATLGKGGVVGKDRQQQRPSGSG